MTLADSGANSIGDSAMAIKPLEEGYDCVGREREIAELARALTPRGAKVVLNGDTGTGKTAIVWGLQQLLDSGDLATILPNCKVFRLNDLSAPRHNNLTGVSGWRHPKFVQKEPIFFLEFCPLGDKEGMQLLSEALEDSSFRLIVEMRPYEKPHVLASISAKALEKLERSILGVSEPPRERREFLTESAGYIFRLRDPKSTLTHSPTLVAAVEHASSIAFLNALLELAQDARPSLRSSEAEHFLALGVPERLLAKRMEWDRLRQLYQQTATTRFSEMLDRLLGSMRDPGGTLLGAMRPALGSAGTKLEVQCEHLWAFLSKELRMAPRLIRKALQASGLPVAQHLQLGDVFPAGATSRVSAGASTFFLIGLAGLLWTPNDFRRAEPIVAATKIENTYATMRALYSQVDTDDVLFEFFFDLPRPEGDMPFEERRERFDQARELLSKWFYHYVLMEELSGAEVDGELEKLSDFFGEEEETLARVLVDIASEQNDHALVQRLNQLFPRDER